MISDGNFLRRFRRLVFAQTHGVPGLGSAIANGYLLLRGAPWRELAARRASILKDIAAEAYARGDIASGAAWERRAMAVYPDDPSRHVAFIQRLVWEGRIDAALAEAEKMNFRHFDHLRPVENHDITPWERVLLAEIATFTAQTPDAATALIRAVEYVLDAGIEGDFVECGVFMGASVVLMARTLLKRNVSDRKIWLYDTFEGMPEPSEKDVFYDGTRLLDIWKRKKRPNSIGSDDVYGPEEKVEENCRRTGYPRNNLIFVKGLVEDMIPERAPGKIALLRLDTDYYASTKHELEHLYPRLVKGGVLIIDDYGAHKGSQLATDEYIREHNLRLFLCRVNEHVRFAVKVDD
jgi:hypothetical protein